MGQRFIRRTENFICDNCGKKVIGDGYTNHCPYCLFSKHVDNFPGDRMADCKGLMKPVRIEFKKGEYSVFHKCNKCKHIKKNILSNKDNFEIILKIMEGSK